MTRRSCSSVEYRSAHPFTSLDELLEEGGELGGGLDEQAGGRAASAPTTPCSWGSR